MNQSSTSVSITIAGMLSALALSKGLTLTPDQALALVGLGTSAAGVIGHFFAGWFHRDAPTLPPPGVKSLLLAFLVLPMLIGACATTPTQTQQAGIAVATDLAVGLAVQNGTKDAAVWKARATEFKTIAITLQTLNSAGALTLQTLAADLQPLIAKLGPADVLAANALVAALTPFLQQQIAANPTVANTQAAIAQFLSTVIAACAAYGA